MTYDFPNIYSVYDLDEKTVLELLQKLNGNTIDKIELINGDLIVTLTNEEIYNLGQLKGDKGEKGDTGVGIGEVQFFDYHLTFVMTDDNIIQLGNIRGSKGEKGDTGDKGDKGEQGDTGVGIDEVQFFDYELTFVMTDENAIQLGNIRGAKGEKGDKGDYGAISTFGVASESDLVVSSVGDDQFNDRVLISGGTFLMPNGKTYTFSSQTYMLTTFMHPVWVYITQDGEISDSYIYTSDVLGFALALVDVDPVSNMIQNSTIEDKRRIAINLDELKTELQDLTDVKEDVLSLQADKVDKTEQVAKDNAQDICITELTQQLTDANKVISNMSDGRVTVDGGYGNVSALPKTAAIAAMNSILYGATATNLVVNGDFSNGTTGWGAAGYGNITAANKELTCTLSVLSASSRIEQDYTAIVDNKYYVKGMIYPKYNTATHLQIGHEDTNLTFIPAANQWNLVSGIVIATTTDKIRFYHKTDTQYAVGDTFKLKDIVAINLTAQGEDTLTLAQLDAKYANYFSGTQSAQVTCIESKDKDGKLVGEQYIEPYNLRRHADGTTDTIDTAKNEYIKRLDDSGVKLAEPIIMQGIVTDNILSRPNGTIQFGNKHSFTSMVVDGKLPTRTGYADIAAIERLEKLNTDSTLTPLDISTATIAVDKRSISHPQLANGDIARCKYAYSFGGVNGRKDISYVTGQNLVTDSVTNKVYKVGKAIADGVMTDTMTEVL